jgi:uncharacterized membrane protein YdfJ with MMPL/SSD domain
VPGAAVRSPAAGGAGRQRSGPAPGHQLTWGGLAAGAGGAYWSAAIAALLTLLLAAFGLYSSLGAPLAIAIAIMLLAGLTLLPALLAISGRAAFWPSKTTRGSGRLGWWGRTASRIVARPAATLALGLLAFGAVATVAIG